MKRLNLIAGLISSSIMFFGSIIPLLNGILFAFIDSMAWLIWDHFMAPGNVEYNGGFFILGMALFIFAAALLVCVFSIDAYVASIEEKNSKCVLLYILTCFLTLFGTLMEVLYVTWLNTQERLIIHYGHVYYLWPILNALVLIVLVVITSINLILMKETR